MIPATRDLASLPLSADHAVLALYQANHGALVRFAFLLSGDRHVAEDLVHEAFARLYANWKRLRDHEMALAYVKRSIVNLVRGGHRKAQVAERRHLFAVPDADSAEDGALGREERRAVLAALGDLPPRQRACLVLRHFEHLSESEIAATLDCSVGSVRTHLKRGKAALGKALEGLR